MSELTAESRLTISPEVVSQELENEMVLLDLERAEYYGLNSTGTRIWRLLSDGLPLGAVADRVAAEFGIEASRATADVFALAATLLAEGLVQRVDRSPEP